MDISNEELPITSFFSRAVKSKKKENLPLTRATGKRKRGGMQDESDSSKEKGKRKKPSTAALDRTTPKKSVHMHEAPRALMSKEKQAPKEFAVASRSRTPPSSEIVDLTTPSPDGKNDRGPSKRRKTEKGSLTSHTLASEKHTHIVGQIFPTPPPSDQKTGPRMIPGTSYSVSHYQPVTNGALPTPETTLVRPINRPRPSRLNKVTFPEVLTSPLASKKGVLDTQPPSSSPLSPCPSDQRLSAGDGIVVRRGHVTQALLDVAPKRHNNVIGRFDTLEGNAKQIVDDDPFAAPVAEIIIPPSQPLHSQCSSPSSRPSSPAYTGISTKTAPIFAVPSVPNPVLQLHITEPHHPTDTNLSPLRAVVESSQSQHVLPSADSPRRATYLHQSVAPSSQSQVLLPFMDSPRRMRLLFSPKIERNKHSDLDDGGQIVGSSQSQTEKDLSLSMGVSQIGLFTLPPAVQSTSQEAHCSASVPIAFHMAILLKKKLFLCSGIQADNSIPMSESMLPESIPQTPPNKRAPRWRSLHIGSSPLPPVSHPSFVSMPSYEGKDVFDEGQRPSIDDDDAKDLAVCAEVNNIRSQSVGRASASGPAPTDDTHIDDSSTESESESEPEPTVAKFDFRSKPERCDVHLVQSQVQAVGAKGEQSLVGVFGNSLVSRHTSNSSLRHTEPYAIPSQPLSEEDTQALYLAGAPLSLSDYSLRTAATDESTQSLPPAVRDFIEMFDDDDDGSYPRYFPMDLRF